MNDVKNKYIIPEMELIILNSSDIVTTSGFENLEDPWETEDDEF